MFNLMGNLASSSAHLLVQVRVECDLLDVLGFAQLDEGLAGTVAAVEDLLEDVEHSVCGPVRLVVILNVRGLNLLLRGQAATVLHELDNGLRSHPAALSSEVDAFSTTFGDVSGGVTNQRNPALHPSRASVFRDRVSLDLDDFATLQQ